ncbi:MAG: hypothetical protein M3370_08900, partial [Actinomycetota bacterium]|nr:hypothetical protein [Actinomycetota bacterium]
SAIVLAVMVAPLSVAASGDALREGVRNGTTTKETEIIGEFNAGTGAKGGYVTRQSNTQTGPNAGGGAIYGCRGAAGGTPAGSAPCLRASNLADGYAFELASKGLVGGLITLGDPTAPNPGKPFVTNATGVATGLNADQVDGKDAAELTGAPGPKGDKGDPGTSVFTSSIPSGATVAGAWGGRYIAPQLAGNNSYLISTSFPVKSPVPLADSQVNAAPNAAAQDPDPSCTGSSDNPTAPAGKVCVYISRANNAAVAGFRLTDPGTAGSSPGDAYGFIVRILDAGSVGNTATTNAEGTWAYTAP